MKSKPMKIKEKKDKKQIQEKTSKIMRRLKTSRNECPEARDWKTIFSLSVQTQKDRIKRDWTLLLVVGFLFLLVIFAIDGNVFYGVYVSDEKAQTKEEIDNKAVDEILLEEVLGSYKKKQETFQDRKQTIPSVVDPTVDPGV